MEANSRRVRYQVAASLDGFITDDKGGADWIVSDRDIDFGAHFAQFDTFLIGRRTFEAMPPGSMSGMNVLVFSSTLRQEDHPNVRIVNANAKAVVEELKQQPGKDIWLFGGGELFGSLLALGVVDTVELAMIPVLLGSGTPVVPAGAHHKLSLTGHRVFPKSGIVMLEYDVQRKRARTKARALESTTQI